MVEVGKFVDELKSAGVEFFTGVPDSLSKSFCAYVTDKCGEGRAISMDKYLLARGTQDAVSSYCIKRR